MVAGWQQDRVGGLVMITWCASVDRVLRQLESVLVHAAESEIYQRVSAWSPDVQVKISVIVVGLDYSSVLHIWELRLR